MVGSGTGIDGDGDGDDDAEPVNRARAARCCLHGLGRVRIPIIILYYCRAWSTIITGRGSKTCLWTRAARTFTDHNRSRNRLWRSWIRSSNSVSREIHIYGQLTNTLHCTRRGSHTVVRIQKYTYDLWGKDDQKNSLVQGSTSYSGTT